MRVLFVSAPLLGHLYPLIPMATALRDAGHEVLLAAGGDVAGHDLGALPVADVLPGFDFGSIARKVMLRHPIIARSELAGDGGTRGVALLFGQVNEQLADPVVAQAKRWRPDLIVHEPLAVAGAIAAATLGVPAVLQENSLFDPEQLVRVTAAKLSKTLARHGLDELPPAAATLTVAPPTVVGVRPGWQLRYVPYSGPGEAPQWLTEPGDRPRILVSRSTVTGPGGGNLMSSVLAVADSVDAEVVLIRPDRTVLRRKALPGNVRTVEWVPLTDVLPACAAIVHHGGAGSVLGALAAGVPQLVVAGPGDRKHNAWLVADRGAGVARTAGQITAADLNRLLTDPALKGNADEVRREIAAMPPPKELVGQLEALAG